MKFVKNKPLLAPPGLLILIILIPLVALLILAHQNKLGPGGAALGPLESNRPGGVKSWPVISRNVPAFASSDSDRYLASYANDASYDTSWWATANPAWLAYDLSGVPTADRGKVLVVWYNDSYNYDPTLINSYSDNVPENYTIDVNASPGGGDPPGTGWVTLVNVKGNHYHSRQHVIDMAGYNWIRINVTTVMNVGEGAKINMDVYDASYGTADDWIFFGDSITANTMGQPTIGGVKSFAQLINQHLPNNFPVQEAGGIGGLSSVAGAENINTWLRIFPGKYVVLSFGTNDAIASVSADNFYRNYVTMVRAVLNAGKIPVIPHIPWARHTNIQYFGPALNARIDALYKAFPQIIKGPDLWTFFQSHQNLISNDNIHPTEVGDGAYRQQWANAMLAEVYTKH